MAAELINKYYNDIVINKTEYTNEMFNTLYDMDNNDIDTNQAFVRRDFLLKLHKKYTTLDKHEANLREFETCEPGTHGLVVRNPNHWTVQVTSWDDFHEHCYALFPTVLDYETAYEDSRVYDYLCDTFERALRLITAANESTGVNYCITLRFDKRTLGLYWQIPPKWHWSNRKACNYNKCTCCTGHLDWTPIFRVHHNAWENNPGSTAREFYQDFLHTHDITTARYGTHIYPRVAEPAPAADVEPAPVHDDETVTGKRTHDDEPPESNKVRVLVDLTDDHDASDHEDA